MPDKFILCTKNFDSFNYFSEIPLIEEIVVRSLQDYQQLKKAFGELTATLSGKTLLYKNPPNTVACVLNGIFYPLGAERTEYAYPLVDYYNLPQLVNLIISINEDNFKKRVVKRIHLDTFITTLELALPSDTSVRIYTRDNIDD